MDYRKTINRLNDYIRWGIPSVRVADAKTAVSAIQELQKYKQLGTLEEVRDAVEKQKRKKPCASNRCYVCPRCGLVTSLRIKHNYCDACDQHIDWSVKE